MNLYIVIHDKYMRHFVRESIKGGKVGAFNQYYESKVSDNIFETITEELKIQGTKYEIIEKNVKYIKDIKSQYEKEYDSKTEFLSCFEGYPDFEV